MKHKIIIILLSTLVVVSAVTIGIIIHNKTEEIEVVNEAKEQLSPENDIKDFIEFDGDDYTTGFEEDYQRQVEQGMKIAEGEVSTTLDDSNSINDHIEDLNNNNGYIEPEKDPEVTTNDQGKIEEIEFVTDLSDGNNTTPIIWN